MDEAKAKQALELIVGWFDTPPPTTDEQNAQLAEGLRIARELVGSE